MKNILISLLLAAGVALGALGVYQQREITRLKARLESSQTQLNASQERVRDMSEAAEKAALAEKRAKVLQGTLTQLSAAAAKQGAQLTQLEQSQAEAKTNQPAPGLAAMFKDPKMKEMMKAQQKAIVIPMMEKQYAALFQQLQLTPEQTARMKELLGKKLLVSSEMGMSMMGGKMDATKRAELANQIKSETDAYDEQIRQLLGDDNYAAYQDYQKTIPDRVEIGQIRDQLAGTPAALSADQEQQLIQAMQDERKSFKWTIDYSEVNQPDKLKDMNLADMFNEKRLDQFAREKARFDQEFLDRAKNILTPEQIKEFEKSQTTLRQLQTSMMKMAAKMFAPKSQ